MEQGTATQPNRATFNRLTAKAYWFPTETPTAGIDFGVIDGTALDEGIAREKVMFPIDGNVVLGYDEVVSVSPTWMIKGKQFHDPILPILYMGTANTDVTQGSGSGLTFTIVGITLGRSYDIGARNVTITGAGVTVGGVTKTEGVDYFMEPNRGMIRFPFLAAGIASGATIIVNFSKPAIVRRSITAFNKLNQTGVLQLFEMDGINSAIPLSEGTLAGSLSRDKSNDGDPTKTNQWALRMALNGYGNFLRRAA